MKIVAVTACTVGVAHTYIAKDRLIEAATKKGHQIHVETQGTIGIEDALNEQDIKACDVVLFAADVAVAHEERFQGKPIVRVRSEIAIKQPEKLLEKIEMKLKEN